MQFCKHIQSETNQPNMNNTKAPYLLLPYYNKVDLFNTERKINFTSTPNVDCIKWSGKCDKNLLQSYHFNPRHITSIHVITIKTIISYTYME